MIVGADFIRVGSKLAANNIGEPEWRTSISRSYYGAYHHAREFLQAKLRIACPANAQSHEIVKRAFDFSGNTELKIVASMLSTLRTMRNKADYDIGEGRYGTQQVAMDASIQAHSAKTKLDEVLSAEILKNAQNAIKAKIHLLSGVSVLSDL